MYTWIIRTALRVPSVSVWCGFHRLYIKLIANWSNYFVAAKEEPVVSIVVICHTKRPLLIFRRHRVAAVMSEREP